MLTCSVSDSVLPANVTDSHWTATSNTLIVVNLSPPDNGSLD